jgi:hypothetical protein
MILSFLCIWILLLWREISRCVPERGRFAVLEQVLPVNSALSIRNGKALQYKINEFAGLVSAPDYLALCCEFPGRRNERGQMV